MASYRWTAIFLTLALAPAQIPDAPPDTVIRINVNLVQVDAIVTDSKDRPVTDLKAEDFIVLQDGKPQKIANFGFINTRAATGTVTAVGKPAAQPKNAPPTPPPPPMALKPQDIRRTVALVVDDLGLSWEAITRVRQSLKKWVDNDMQAGDLVAVIRTGAGMGALQQFTSDKRMLYAAIERVKYNSLGRVGISSFAPLEGVDPDIPPIDTTRPDEEREQIFGAGSLGAIRYVVEGLKEVPGRKSLILFSESMRMLFTDGPSDRVMDQVKRLVDAANRSSVVIYGVDPRGVIYTGLTAADNTRGRTAQQISSVQSQRSQQLFDSQEGMVMLAHDTGGLFLQNNNDIDAQLRKAVADGDGYYLIGYHPDASTFDEKTGRRKFHNVSVRLKQKGLHVRSRSGFFGTSDRLTPPVPHDRKSQITRALFSPFLTGALHLRLTTLFSQTVKSGPFVNAMLHFDARELKFTDEPDDWHKALVDTVAITYNADGQQVDVSDKTWTIRVQGKTYQDMLRKGVLYSMHVPVKKAGGYQMRVVLRDGTSEQVGSATQFIEVPDVSKGRLTLSGIVLSGDKPPAAKTEEGGVAQVEGQITEEDPNATPAVRIFKPGAVIAYAYQILNAQAGDDSKPQLEVQTRLFRDGKQVYVGKPAMMATGPQDDPKRLIGGGRMQLGKIAAGDYALQVVVTDKLAKDKYRIAAQSMDFEIR